MPLRKHCLALLWPTLCLPAFALAGQGPSSSQSPYLVPIAPGVEFTSILTVGDAVTGRNKTSYRMAGIPDGLGVYDNGDGSITVLMNHELKEAAGAQHAHGGKGAFVSQWRIRKQDLKVIEGKDLIKEVHLADGNGWRQAPGAGFNRFCSADLPAATAFYNKASGKGYRNGRIFMNGEETKGGRAFAHLMSGQSYELAKLGRFAWENAVASPYAQDKTLVAGLDDTGGGKLHFYVGKKTASGNPVERAGLANGIDYLVSIDGQDKEPALGFKSGRFKLVADGTGTGFERPEDGAWDSQQPNRFYFVTTAGFAGNSRLWRVSFDAIDKPELGGRIEVLVDGAKDGPRMMDNLTVDSAGNVYIQEDVGDQSHLGRIWLYNPERKALVLLAQHDEQRFLKDGKAFLTEDEESSGIVEVSAFFKGVRGYDTKRNRYFLFDVQAHYKHADAELVEGGQLLLMKVPR
ncbi:MAG: hypothetical protein HXY26_07305 [Hydrogenophilaceae bacterium]|nr:hypothetical protein [Hydrogenophilaceae bacterium]